MTVQLLTKIFQVSMMYDAVIVWAVYKLKECSLLDILDDEIRGTLGKSSDKAA